MVLGDVEETIYVVEENEDEEDVVRVRTTNPLADQYFTKAFPVLQTIHKKSEMLFVRGEPCLF